VKNKGFRKFISIALSVSLMLGAFGFSPFAGQASAAGLTTVKAGYGQFQIELTADPETVTPPVGESEIEGQGGFGTSDSAGRIWTDKSVTAKSNGSFDVTLSALAQEYTTTTASTNPGVGGDRSDNVPAADVTFILDMSTSMNKQDIDPKTGTTKYRRVEAMAMAANDTIRKLMDANTNNRVAVYWFGNAATGAHVGTMMGLKHYDLPQGQNYLIYDKTDYSITPNSSLGVAADKVTLEGGTPTQDGIMYGISSTLKQLGETDDGPKRQPFVLILSDGAAVNAKKAWYTAPNYNKSFEGDDYPDALNDAVTISNYNRPSTDNSNYVPTKGTADTTAGDPGVAALTVLTGAYMKKIMGEQYTLYNGGEETPAIFYTVGLGTRTAINGENDSGVATSAVYAWAGLDPQTVADNKDNDNFRKGTAKATYGQIKDYADTDTPNNWPKNLPEGLPSVPDDVNYAKAFAYSNYYTFASNYTALDGAFTGLSSDVEAATTILPLLDIHQNDGLGDNSETADMDSAIVFVDEISEGFSVDTLRIGGTVAEIDEDTSITDTNATTYKFAGYGSKVVVKPVGDGDATSLTWYIDADDMKPHIYRFASRTNPQQGEYKAPTDSSFTLNYNVKPAFPSSPDIMADTVYYLNSGNETTAYFSTPEDSPYYNALAETETKTRTLSKTSDRIGGTAVYVNEESLSSDGKVTMKLGNNGKLEPKLKIEMSPAFGSVPVGENVTYRITVTNLTSDVISKVVVDDVLLGDLSFVTGSMQKDSIDDPTGKFAYTISSVPANGSVVLTFKAAVPPGAEEGDEYTSSASITSVNEMPLSTAATVESAKVTVVDTLSPSVTVMLDGEVYPDQTVELRKDGEDSTILTYNNDDEAYTASDITPGTYNIYVNGEDTGETLSGSAAETTINYYSVSFFDGAQEYETPAKQVVLSGREADAPTAPTKTGYTFVQWVTKDAEDDTTVFDFDTAITKTTEIYATWEAVSTTVTLDVYGGIGGSESVTATYDLPMPSGAIAPSKAGYKFVGYFDQPISGGNKYYKSDMASANKWDKTDEEVTLYARWTAKDNVLIEYTVNNAVYGTVSPFEEEDLNPEIGTPTGSTATANPGYRFVEWQDGSHNQVSKELKFVPKKVDGSYESATYTAIFEVITYNITYNNLDAWTTVHPSNRTTYTVEDENFTLTNPTKSGYTFTGWTGTGLSDPSLTVKIVKGSTGNLNYTANWQDVPSTGTYDVVGTVIDDDTPSNKVDGATVEIVKGNTQYGDTATTDADGNFTIRGVPAGTYDIKITLKTPQGEKTAIIEKKIDGPSQVVQLGDVILPYRASSELTLLGSDTPAIVIDNLHPEAESILLNDYGNAGFVKVEMQIEKIDENKTDRLEAIGRINARTQSENVTIGLYLDMIVERFYRLNENVKWDSEGLIPRTNGLIKVSIPIPAELQGKSSYTVYRYHEGAVNTISAVKNDDLEYLDLDKSDWTLTLYVRNFSVYAIAYDNPQSQGSSGGWGTTNYTVTFDGDGGTPASTTQSVAVGALLTKPADPVRAGYIFAGWYKADGSEWDFSTDKVSSVTTLTAKWTVANTDKPALDKENHFAYMTGYPDRTFGPQKNMTRAEVTVMFARLLVEKMDVDKKYPSKFKDVDPATWYANAVGYMEQYGIITGYSDGTFKPGASITRAEFAAIASRFDTLVSGEPAIFTDVVDDHWAKDYISFAAAKGWVTGYQDGTFKPGNYITRAEVVSLVNRMLERYSDRSYVDHNQAMLNQYIDLTSEYWAYYDIMEATNGHDYDKTSNGETWTSPTKQ